MVLKSLLQPVNDIHLVRKDMDVNEQKRLFNFTLKTQIKVQEQLVVRNDMDVNEQKSIPNFTVCLFIVIALCF